MHTASIFMDYPLNNSYIIFTYISQSHRDIQPEVSITGHLRGTFPYLRDILETLPCGRSGSLACVSSLNGLSICLQWLFSHHFTYNYFINRSHSGKVWDRGIKILWRFKKFCGILASEFFSFLC